MWQTCEIKFWHSTLNKWQTHSTHSSKEIKTLDACTIAEDLSKLFRFSEIIFYNKVENSCVIFSYEKGKIRDL